jgi:RNA polymerase sigma-70 factor (ECF subfamily)
MSNIDSAMLVERFQDGETGVFDEIVGRCQKSVYNLAYHFTHNCEDAYDISQEVFIKAFKSLGKLRENATFDAWIRKITVNTCIDFLRKHQNEYYLDDFSQLPQIVERGDKTPPITPVEAKELRAMIIRAVDQLPEKQKKVFILRYYEDLSIQEIANILSRSEGTVKANLFHATRRLRELLTPYVS